MTTLAVGLLVTVVVAVGVAVEVAVDIAVDFEKPAVEDYLADAESRFTAAEGTWKVIWEFRFMFIPLRINSSL